MPMSGWLWRTSPARKSRYTGWVLARAEDVEVAQVNGVETVATGKHVGIQLVDVLCHGVGAERLPYEVFDLGQARVIAVGAAAGGVSK